MERELLDRMAGALRHRGPDDEGIYEDRKSGLGLVHRRLSIIDLTTGHQPMSDRAGECWIVFNGEIYNYRELRSELKSLGHHFLTSSDTEVIISMYKQWGETAFARLNGIFAFALYDSSCKRVMLARDHFGVKPLYYWWCEGTLLFGSEIKAILQDSAVPREIDFDALNSFLTFRYNPSPQTLIKGVCKLPPGHLLVADSTGLMTVEPYWASTPTTDTRIPEADAIAEYSRLLENAVRRQMVSDVPVGLFLSGGVDSAAIAYLMRQHTGERIKTFTIGFPGRGDYNELDDARSTARLLDTDHQELSIARSEYLEFFLRSFEHTEEPIAEPTIPALYHVSKLASKDLKVVLAGQGADEPLAGYARYLGESYANRFGGLLRLVPTKAVAAVIPRNERLKRGLFAVQSDSETERFLNIYAIFTPAQKKRLLLPWTSEQMQDVDEELIRQLHKQTFGLTDSLNRLLYIDTRMSLPDDLLLFGDKVTMANSLEMRVPFLDLELITFLESLPGSFKLKGRTRKYIHKKAVERWLPREIVHRKKRGFATPMDEWLQTDLAATARELITESGSASRTYFDVAYASTLIDAHQRRRENYQKQIFGLLSFELWHRSFFNPVSLDKELLQHAH